MLRNIFLILILLTGITAGADIQFQVGDLRYVAYPESQQATVAGYVGTTQTDLVAIPASVSHNGTQYTVSAIGAEAFASKRGVGSISIPASVKEIGDNAFCLCFHLQSIEVAPDNICFCSDNGVLFNKDKTFLIAYPTARSIDSIYTVPATVKHIGISAFYYSRLTGINLPASLKTIGNEAFYGCSALTDIGFPLGLQSIGEKAFYMCRSLTTLSLPDNLTIIPANSFGECSGLVSVKLPQRLQRICSGSFGGCEALAEITLPPSIDSLSPGAFADCPALKQVNIPDGSPKFASVGGILFNKNLTDLLLYPAGRTDTIYTLPPTIVAIGPMAFFTNRNLKSVKLPLTLHSIGNEAFRFCSSLSAVSIPDAVETIGAGAFQECLNLNTVHLPSGLTEITQRMFYMTAVEQIEIPQSVRCIGEYAFYSTPLSHINLPDATEEIGNSAFMDIYSLQTANLGAGMKRIGEGAFAQCALLRRIEFSPVLEKIGPRAFYACWSLTEANLPSTVTELGREAFGGCITLRKIILPPQVSAVDSYCFYKCNALRDLFVLSTYPPAVATDAFTIQPAAVRLYVPMQSEHRYAAASYWSDFILRKAINFHYLGHGDNELTMSPDSMTLLIAPRPRTSAPILSSRWFSDNPTVALTDSLGLVRALSEGTATVWHIAQDSAMNELRTKCVVTVAHAGVTASAADAAPMPGDAIFTLTGTRIADLYRNPDAATRLPDGIFIIRRNGITRKFINRQR